MSEGGKAGHDESRAEAVGTSLVPARRLCVRESARFAVVRRSRGSLQAKKRMGEKTNFASGFNADSTVRSSLEKYTASVFRKNVIVWRHPVSMQRAYRDRHDT